MRKIKLGLLAVALLGTVAAFASKKATTETPCTLNSFHDRIAENCTPPGPLCCVTDDQTEIDGQYPQ